MKKRRKRIDLQHQGIPTKANRILNIVLAALILIFVRVWHLTVNQHEVKLEESHKPQRKVVIEPAIRGTIRDRYNIPLAINKIRYQAAILYAQIREIPPSVWVTNEEGVKIRKPKRKEYIHQISGLLADELNLDADKIEDLIHSKAAFYPQIPFIIKEELTEKEYYRLKMLEKDWPGLRACITPKRYYPQGRVGGDIIGYLGAISKKEHDRILQEIRELEEFLSNAENNENFDLPERFSSLSEVRGRLKDLIERAYSIHDHVGKTGIEGVFEEKLRGFCGKKRYSSDSKGNFLRELPGTRPALSGQRLLLTISSELQSYAEQLLTQNEQIRVVRKTSMDSEKKTVVSHKSPWIKGGAIVAMDPNNGDILALASYPRFDPNDFVPSGDPEERSIKQSNIQRWFENERHLAEIWNQKQPLRRERYDDQTHQFYDEQKYLTWNAYLDFILPFDSQLRRAMDGVFSIGQAIEIQQHMQPLLDQSNGNDVYSIFNQMFPAPLHTPFQTRKKVKELHLIDDETLELFKIHVEPYFTGLHHNYDKVLLLDLCRLAIDHQLFTDELISAVSHHSLNSYHNASGALVTIKQVIKEMMRDLFHEHEFKHWRVNEEKAYLKQKREEEKIARSYPKPYLDYLNKKEEELFNHFWKSYQWEFLVALLMGTTIKPEPSLELYFEPLFKLNEEFKQGAHQALEWRKSFKILQDSIKDLPQDLAINYMKTMRSFSELERPLLGKYRGLRGSGQLIEKNLAAAFFPIYGWSYGRSYAYRQSATQGSIFKIVVAYEALKQQLKRLNVTKGTVDELNPLTIVEQSHYRSNSFCIGYTKEGESIPQVYKGGRLPRSLAHKDPGKLDLVKAMGVSSNPYFSLLAGDFIEDPEDLLEAARQFSYGSKTGIELNGEISGSIPKDVHTNRTGLYALAIGQHSLVVTPLQTAVMLSAVANGGDILKPNILHLIAGREPVRSENPIVCLPSFPYQEYLNLVGVDYPLFTILNNCNQKSAIKQVSKKVQRHVDMPESVRNVLLQGLRMSTNKSHADNNSRLANLYRQHPEAMKTFTELKNQVLGKTSTSESVEQVDLDINDGTNIYTHVWFSGIAFKPKKFIYKDEFGKPELVVVVYLRYGGYGKEAAPLAAQIVKKWREIKELHGDEE